MQIKYFDKRSLITANNDAIIEGRNRSIREDVLDDLDEDHKFPVFMAVDHNSQEMRVGVMLSSEAKAWLDISYEGYESLPTVDMPVN